MNQPAEMPFRLLLDALLDADNPLPPRYLYRLSDLTEDELAQFRQTWPEVPEWRRRAVMQDIEEIGADDYLLAFDQLAILTLEDWDAQVRLMSVRTLWEYEDQALMERFLHLIYHDSDSEVRAAAAYGLGKYVYLGEIEEIPEESLREVEANLLNVTQGEDQVLVRRRALEALGYSGRPEVAGLIEKAYASEDKNWQASALLAMGRSANEAWGSQVLSKLDSPFPAVRTEAARAAGELEIRSALTSLIQLLDDPDENVRAASIWSLSQIGGEGVGKILEQMYEETEDDEEADYIESALDNLAFTEDMQLFDLFDVVEDEVDGDEGDDLEDDEGEEDFED